MPLERAYLTKTWELTTRLTLSGILSFNSSTWRSLKRWGPRHTACIEDVSSAQRALLSEMWVRGVEGDGALYVTRQ